MARSFKKFSDLKSSFYNLPAAALRACWREGKINPAQLRHDLVAGILVGIIALPLAMALSIAVGLPPQHGLYTVIFAGGISALLGGSRLNIVGPTAAFVVILGPIVQTYGLPGLLLSGMLAGLILMAMALLRLGSLIEYIPYPVTTGFTSGIAVVIAGLQIKDLLGLQGDIQAPHFLEKMAELWQLRGSASFAEITVSLATLVILFLTRMPAGIRRFLPKWILVVPGPVLALPLAALLAIIIEKAFPGVNIVTLGERFTSVVNGVEMHGIPRTLPAFALPWNQNAGVVLDLNLVRTLLPSALTIALLAAIESLLSAVVVDGMARTRHDPDSELFALGVGNFIAPFFAGIPATGAIARSASNYRFGGRTPISAFTHAVTVLLAVLALAPLVSYIPMSSMAALLVMVAWNMSEFEHFVHTLKAAPRSDAAVLVICFALTIALDMVIAVAVGVLLGALFFIRRMAQLTEGGLVDVRAVKEYKLSIPPTVVLYSIHGPLFFGATERAIGALRTIGEDVKVVIFVLNEVVTADMTGLVAMEGVVAELRYHGIKTILVGTRSEVKNLFRKGGLVADPESLAYYDTLKEALEAVGGKVERMPRQLRSEPIRIQPLHRQRQGATNPQRSHS